MGIRALDDRAKVPQTLPHRQGGFGIGDVVQDRLVVFVHQDHRPLAVLSVGLADQFAEATGHILGVRTLNAQPLLVDAQDVPDAPVQFGPALQHPFREAEVDHRIAHRPVPAVVDIQAAKQRFVALEQLLEGVEEQAFAEAPRAGEEVIARLLGQTPGHRGLVHIVVVLLANLGEGLDADGQFAARRGHGGRVRNGIVTSILAPWAGPGQKAATLDGWRVLVVTPMNGQNNRWKS